MIVTNTTLAASACGQQQASLGHRDDANARRGVDSTSLHQVRGGRANHGTSLERSLELDAEIRAWEDFDRF